MEKSKVIGVGAAIAIAVVLAGIFAFYSMDSDPVVPASEIVTTLSLSSPSTIAEGSISSAATDQNTNRIYVTYFQKQDDNVTNLFLISSDDNGKTFSEPTRVNEIDDDATANGVAPPMTQVGPNGEVCVLWVYTSYEPGLKERGFPFGFTTLRFACSHDGGKTFGPTVRMPEGDKEASQNFAGFNFGPDGTIYVGYLSGGTFFFDKPHESEPSPVVVARSVDGGKSFELTGEVSSISCPCCHVYPAVDEKGVLYVSWRNIYDTPFDDNDIPDENSPEYRDMSVTWSTDKGKTFAAPTKIHDDNALTTECVHSGSPLVFDSKGNLHTVWYTPSEDNPGIYYAVSSDGGKSFSEPITLLTADKVGSSMAKLTVDDKDNAWVVWENRALQDVESWRYEDVSDTEIGIARISPDGKVIKSTVQTDEGKLPLIISSGDQISLVWNAENLVRFASLSTS